MLALQSTGDVESAVKLMQEAVDLDEKCEFAYETLGTIGKAFSAVYRKLPPPPTPSFQLFGNFTEFFSEVQRGNLRKAIELFDKAIPLANTELEMAHLFGLRDASMAQITVSAKFGITLPVMGV